MAVVKVKVTLEQAMKAQRGSRGTALLFLWHYMGLGYRHVPAALLPRKETRYPLYRRLGGPQGRSGEARKISNLAGIQSPGRTARCELRATALKLIDNLHDVARLRKRGANLQFTSLPYEMLKHQNGCSSQRLI